MIRKSGHRFSDKIMRKNKALCYFNRSDNSSEKASSVRSSLSGVTDFAGFGGDAVAELFQHVGHHHPDHDLVFNEEH